MLFLFLVSMYSAETQRFHFLLKGGGMHIGPNQYSLSCLMYRIKWDDGCKSSASGPSTEVGLGNANDCYVEGFCTSTQGQISVGDLSDAWHLTASTQTPWNPIRFLTEIKVKVPIKLNSESGEDSGGEMKMSKALLTAPHEGKSMETVKILTGRQGTSKLPCFLHHGSQNAFRHRP